MPERSTRGLYLLEAGRGHTPPVPQRFDGAGPWLTYGREGAYAACTTEVNKSRPLTCGREGVYTAYAAEVSVNKVLLPFYTYCVAFLTFP